MSPEGTATSAKLCAAATVVTSLPASRLTAPAAVAAAIDGAAVNELKHPRGGRNVILSAATPVAPTSDMLSGMPSGGGAPAVKTSRSMRPTSPATRQIVGSND